MTPTCDPTPPAVKIKIETPAPIGGLSFSRVPRKVRAEKTLSKVRL